MYKHSAEELIKKYSIKNIKFNIIAIVFNIVYNKVYAKVAILSDSYYFF
jgi:hypothetical protein